MQGLKSEWRKRLPLMAAFVPLLAAVALAASLGGVAAVRPESKSTAATPAQALSQSFREAIRAVQPAVVMIRSESPAAGQHGG